MPEKKGPAPPEVLEERDRITIRFGSCEVIQTKDQLIGRVVNTSHPNSESKDDLSK